MPQLEEAYIATMRQVLMDQDLSWSSEDDTYVGCHHATFPVGCCIDLIQELASSLRQGEHIVWSMWRKTFDHLRWVIPIERVVVAVSSALIGHRSQYREVGQFILAAYWDSDRCNRKITIARK